MSEPGSDERDANDARTNWLAQGEAVKSGALLRAATDDPAVRLVKRIASDVLLLEMTPSRARQLATRFGPALVIEQDRPITQIE
jgi:hypothetical protein